MCHSGRDGLLGPLRSRFSQSLVVAALVGWACSSAWSWKQARLPCLEVELESSAAGRAQLYWSHGTGFKEKHSATRALPGGRRPVRLSFDLPVQSMDALRLDPIDVPSTITITRVRLVTRRGVLIHEIPLSELVAESNLSLVAETSDAVTYRVDAPATDAIMRLALSYPLQPRGIVHWQAAAHIAVTMLPLWLAPAVVFAGLLWLCPQGMQAAGAWCRGQLRRQYVVSVPAGMAYAMVLSIAAYSRVGDHPDEVGHVKAARVYDQRWVPAAIDDPDVGTSLIMPWGYSYLHQIDKVYWLAPKLTSWLPLEPAQRMRFFNAALLALLLGVALMRWPTQRSLILFLCATPQLWYLFSYFNGDALPLAASFFLLADLCRPSSAIRTFIEDPGCRRGRRGAIIWGLGCGLILVSKTNYLIVVAFAMLAVTIEAICQCRGYRHAAKRVAVPGIAAACLAGPIWFHDQAINGFDKHARAEAYVETHAAPEFRPSSAGTPRSHHPLFLKAKGYPLSAVITEFDWVRTSTCSFFGVYGHMEHYANRAFYFLIGTAFMVVTCGLSVVGFACGTRRDAAVLALAWLVAGLAVLQSLYYSWTAGYQPQGRYLMPALPIIMVGVAPALARVPAWVAGALTVTLCGLSLWSFFTVAIPAILK